MAPSILSLEKISVSYNARNRSTEVLSEFSEDFVSGKVYALVGPNGCGKSTLLKVIAKAILPAQGRLTFQIEPKVSTSYMPQNYRTILFPWKPVSSNCSPWWNAPKNNEQVAKLLEQFGIAKQSASYPDRLSGGQQQLVVLCRMLVEDSTFLILDEPFSALDVKKRQIARNALQQAMSDNKCMIVSLHDIFDAIQLADVVLCCDGPPLRIVEAVETSGGGEELAIRIHKILNH
ncbi:MAG: ATP-binding cassette domain-containing protein [Planctomycetia bacterium]